MATIKKIKLNPQAALAEHRSASEAATDNRFAKATEITRVQPTGFSEVIAAKPESSVGTGAAAKHSEFDLNGCVPGAIVHVPLSLIDTNQYSPRHFYKSEEIDRIALTLPSGQDDAAHGFVEGGRVRLIDGGTRFRAAKISDTHSLDVKIEEPPSDAIDLYNRARGYNDQRSQPSAVDHAISLVKLVEGGQVTSQRELTEKVADLSGKPMSEAQVSIYMRVGRMPERVLKVMSEGDETSALAALYAVSELFQNVPEEKREERIEIAVEIAGEIRRRGLNKHKIAELVRSHLEGPKQRQRSTAYPLNIHGHKGQIKMFERRGQIEVSLGGVEEGKLDELKNEIVRTFERFFDKADSSAGIPSAKAE